MTGRVSGAPFPGPSHPRRHTRWGTDPLAAASPAPAPHGSSHNKKKKGGWGERAKAPSPAARIALSFLRSRGEQATQGGKCQERRSHEPTEGHGGFAGSAGSDKENQTHSALFPPSRNNLSRGHAGEARRHYADLRVFFLKY